MFVCLCTMAVFLNILFQVGVGPPTVFKEFNILVFVRRFGQQNYSSPTLHARKFSFCELRFVDIYCKATSESQWLN